MIHPPIRGGNLVNGIPAPEPMLQRLHPQHRSQDSAGLVPARAGRNKTPRHANSQAALSGIQAQAIIFHYGERGETAELIEQASFQENALVAKGYAPENHPQVG